MRATATSSPIHKGKRRLLTSCAIAAGMMALACGGPALAQVAGTGTIVSGGGTPNGVAGTTTTTTVTQAQNVINWVPADSATTGGDINLLPAGSTWNFVGTGDYTVLNRFVDAGGGSLGRQIALNGTVNSHVGSTTGPRGGNIWFYNGGGLLIGASGVVNVGSLVLTTNDIVPTGGLFGPGGEIRFRGASGSTSGITVNGAINANIVGSPGSSYVAIVAPRVVQAGDVRVDGSAAYVAGEQADIRINGGLFDINVLVGAEGGNVIDHSGTTTGPAHLDTNGNQSRIYMVAIPKNDAVTMLVSGAIGYDDALSAQVDPDGAVRLSAGYNITAGELDTTPANATVANITASDTLFRSNTSARASGAFAAAPTQTLPPSPTPLSSEGQFFVEGSGTFIGDASATISIGPNQSGGATGTFTVRSGGRGGAPGNAALNVTGGSLAATGALTISASGTPDALTGDSQGGTASLTITGGSVTGSGVTIEATGAAAVGSNGNGGTGRGGTASFTQTGGAVAIGDMTVGADGFGGTAPGQSGAGVGGTATIDLGGGTITAADLIASASGLGGAGSDGDDNDPANIVAGGQGGLGLGGSATIDIGGSAVVDASILLANATGSGGVGGDFFNMSSFSGAPGPTGNGGDGTGGNAGVNVAGGSITTSSMTADASGIGGNGGSSFFSSSSGGATGIGVGGTGGSGRGGAATIGLAAPLGTVGATSAVSRGTGGLGGTHNVGGDGGDGFGGLAQAIVDDFDAGSLAVTVDATAQGGSGGGGNDGAGGNGGNAVGGTASVLADGPNASVLATQANFATGATGGNGGNASLGFAASAAVAPSGGNAGDGQGGTIEVIARNGATVTIGAFSSGDINLSSTGTGGNGGNGAAADFGMGNIGGDGGLGGGGTGGRVRLAAEGGTITTGGDAIAINVGGISGAGGAGGIAGGGGSLPGAAGAFLGTAGGRALIETLAGTAGPGQIDLGPTSITANGDAAGRIELRAAGAITLAGLDAEALGAADPTNNDTDEAPAGIFVAVDGGTIAVQGDATLTTDSSVGVYGRSNGVFDVNGALTIDAGDQIDIRHDAREGEAATVRAGDSLIATAANSISGAAGSLIGAGDLLSLTVTGPNGTIGVDRLAGTDIVLDSPGATSVEHAEAVNDFTATASSFRTGLNSIITGGDITVTSPGAVDLGNSSAGGFVQVQGQSIVFNTIDAGLSVNLSADGTTPGAEGISGGSINAGQNINLFANSIALTGDVTGDASFFAFGTGGTVAVNNADVAGTISIFSAGDMTGNFVAGGDIFLNSDANITALARANGGYVDTNGVATEGNLFADAIGDVSLTGSSAARMFGVNSGGAATITGATAGEDMLVRAGTTARLTTVSAGDDLTVQAIGDITADDAGTTGAGADTHILGYSVGSSGGVFTIGVGSGTSGTDGADVAMASSAGTIDAAALSAGDDILLNAANSIAVNGATTLGLGTTGGDSSVRTQGGATALGNVDAFSDVIVDAAGVADLTGTVTAGRDATINAQGVTLVTLTDSGGFTPPTLSADGNVVVDSSAGITGGALRAGGDMTLIAGAAIAVTEIEGSSLALSGTTGITADRVRSNGFSFDDTVSLDSGNGDIRIGNLSALAPINASANAIRIESGGPLRFATLTTDVGDAYVHAGSGFTLASGNVAGTADLESNAESMDIASLTAANAVIVNTSGDIALDTATVAGSLDATARGSIGVNGVVTGQSISLASSNINIAATGRLGTAGVTGQLSIANNNADNQTFVGGTAGSNGPNGYHIDADELTRVYGTEIEIFAPEVQAAGGGSVGSAAPPDVVVDSFTMTGGGAGSNLGANGALTIRTLGKMRVIGNIQLTGLTDANALNLIANDALEVILGQGSVRLVNGSDPAGQLNMASDDIIVATQAAIAAVGAATGMDAINQRLGENDGIVLDEGALFARGIRADISGGFYVQNSGAGTDTALRRGLTFGAGGLDVLTQGPSRIAINGVQLGPNGQVTGLDALQLLTIAGSAPVAGTYDRRSTVNGCLIVSPTVCTTVTFDFENNFPVQDVIEEEVKVDEDGGDGNNLPQPLITMRELDPLTGEPLLDDPVTGAGNDDLWTPPVQ